MNLEGSCPTGGRKQKTVERAKFCAEHGLGQWRTITSEAPAHATLKLTASSLESNAGRSGDVPGWRKWAIGQGPKAKLQKPRPSKLLQGQGRVRQPGPAASPRKPTPVTAAAFRCTPPGDYGRSIGKL